MDRLLAATARAERDHFWFKGFRRFVTPLLDRAIDGHDDPLILDCGCGTGHNLQMLRRAGRAVGIDVTFSGLTYAVSRGDRKIAQASAGRLPFGDSIFDLVTSFDVIYSLPDDVERRDPPIHATGTAGTARAQRARSRADHVHQLPHPATHRRRQDGATVHGRAPGLGG